MNCWPTGGRNHDAAIALIGLGALIAAQRETEAVDLLRGARTILLASPDFYQQARAQAVLGAALVHDPQLAIAHLTALEVMHRLDCQPDQASIMEIAGELTARTGRRRKRAAGTHMPLGWFRLRIPLRSGFAADWPAHLMRQGPAASSPAPATVSGAPDGHQPCGVSRRPVMISTFGSGPMST